MLDLRTHRKSFSIMLTIRSCTFRDFDVMHTQLVDVIIENLITKNCQFCWDMEMILYELAEYEWHTYRLWLSWQCLDTEYHHLPVVRRFVDIYRFNADFDWDMHHDDNCLWSIKLVILAKAKQAPPLFYADLDWYASLVLVSYISEQL